MPFFLFFFTEDTYLLTCTADDAYFYMHAHELHVHTRIVNTYKDTCLSTEDTYMLTCTADDSYFHMHAHGLHAHTRIVNTYKDTCLFFLQRIPIC